MTPSSLICARTAFLLSLCSLTPWVQAQDSRQGPTPEQIAAYKEKHLKSPIIINRIAATVNGRIITSNELSMMLMPIAGQLMAQYPRQGPEFVKQLAEAKDKILDELIERELVLTEFDEKGGTIPNEFVDQEIERTIRESCGGNREIFLENLRQSGLTIRGFKDLTKRRLTAMILRSQKYDMDLPPTPQEIEEEYKQTKSQYRDLTQDKIRFEKIFIPAYSEDNASPEEQLALAELIAEQINTKKASFKEMAVSYSKDTQAEKGGQWPKIKRGELSAEFAGILFDSPEGKLVGPLKDPNGFTLFRVQQKELAPAPPLSKVKVMVDEQVRNKKSLVYYKKWIGRLKETALIKKLI